MKKSILYGDLTNLKTSLVQRLEQIYTYLVPREQFSTPELDEELLDLTQQMGREIAVYLNGNGRVMAVSIGDHRQGPVRQGPGPLPGSTRTAHRIRRTLEFQEEAPDQMG